MKKLLLINSVCGIGSTGRICTDIAKEYEQKGYEVKIAYGRSKRISKDSEKYSIRIGNSLDVCFHVLYTRLFDKHGLASKRATYKFLKWASEYDPDVLWLHNIHGYYINYEMLFKWIKKRPYMQVKWTLHDCWTFTGHCPHFLISKCDKWKTGCYSCPVQKEYPQSLFIDNSKNNYIRKKNSFTGIKNMKLITPSKWLADLTRESYLKNYPVEVKHNKIDNNIFKPTPSNLRKELGIDNKIIVLGVANPWSEKKGLNDFITLSSVLSDNYAVILIGLDEKQKIEILDKKVNNKRLYNDESKSFRNNSSAKKNYKIIHGHYLVPVGVENVLNVLGLNNKDSILGDGAKQILLSNTSNMETLAKYYTIADYFVNMTYEDNYPTVNLEAKACGTVVITYDVGGCKETLL